MVCEYSWTCDHEIDNSVKTFTICKDLNCRHVKNQGLFGKGLTDEEHGI